MMQNSFFMILSSLCKHAYFHLPSEDSYVKYVELAAFLLFPLEAAAGQHASNARELQLRVFKTKQSNRLKLCVSFNDNFNYYLN